MSWEYWNPNPVGTRGAGDCAVRAIAKALDITWEQAYVRLALNGFLMGDIMNANYVIGSVLRENGFQRKNIPEDCADCYTVEDLCEQYPEGIYVVFSQDHVATIINGTLFDAWDSSDNKPMYFWTKG